jgi:hypothetical protein
LKVGEGGWIIINDRIFTAPNKGKEKRAGKKEKSHTLL